MQNKSVVVLVNSEKTMRHDAPSGPQTRYAHTPKIVYDTFIATAKKLNCIHVPQLVVFDPEVEISFGGMSYEQLASGPEAYRAIHKAIAEGMKKAALPASAPADSLLGKYEKVSPSSDWHYVTITRGANGSLHWKNRADISWTLEFRNGNELWAAKGCPFGQMKYEIKKDEAGKITGLKFGGSLYRLVADQ
ncbi:hypothetical protein N9A94_05125 [Akkermansiaceae bacterium]|nr:hypothetical protein [Akkermansiaceae bacterium]MDB4544730.1 hypothetical protein [Akkermansiaceae bacterium]